MQKIIPKITRVNVARLFLDAENPRLPESADRAKIWEHMNRAYDLHELALSIVNNGYFEAEPLVAIPKDKRAAVNASQYERYVNSAKSEYIVVEGNRRLATVQGLQKGRLLDRDKKPYQIPADIQGQFDALPVLVYPNRDEVLAFLGVHHLAGVRKWNVYERARYVVYLKDTQNKSMDEIQRIIGDRKNSARKTYVCYRLIELVREFDSTFDIQDAKNNFSFLQLATSQEPIKDFIGLAGWNSIDVENPIPKDRKENLKFLFECLFDNGSVAKSLIKESRQITSHLSKILDDDDATEILREERNIERAFEFIGGDLIGMNKLTQKAKSGLETVNGKLSGIDDLQDTMECEEGEKLKKGVISISNVVADIRRKI